MSFVVCEESPFTTFWLKLEGFYFLNSEMKQWWKHGMNEKFGQKREKSWKKGQRIDEKSYNPISILWWVLRINQLRRETRKFTIVQGLMNCVMVLEYFGHGLVQLLVATVIWIQPRTVLLSSGFAIKSWNYLYFTNSIGAVMKKVFLYWSVQLNSEKLRVLKKVSKRSFVLVIKLC